MNAQHYDREVWVRYRYMLGPRGVKSEEWSDRGAVSHAVLYGRTLCGATVTNIQHGWAKDNYARRVDADTVTCKRCLRSMAKETR